MSTWSLVSGARHGEYANQSPDRQGGVATAGQQMRVPQPLPNGRGSDRGPSRSDLAALCPQCTLKSQDSDGAMRRAAVDGPVPGTRRWSASSAEDLDRPGFRPALQLRFQAGTRSEEHTSELQSL